MQKYNSTLRLGGALTNTVSKNGVTAAEILVLRGLHGEEAVVDISETEMDKRDHAQERGRLVALYGHKVVTALFGAPYANNSRLPVKLDDFQGLIPSMEEDENLNTFGIVS